MNERGQEFSGFRLLIDAILVLLILVIIMGIMGWVASLRFQISEQMLYEGFDKAVNSPDGKVVVEKNIMLKAGSIYTVGTFEKPGVERDCISLDGLGMSSLVIGERQVAVEGDIQLDIFYQCERRFGADCDMVCRISFGKEFEQ